MQLWILIKKEFLIELRAKDTLISMIIFGISIILLFSFTLPLNNQRILPILPGLIWMTMLFIFTVGLLRNFSREKEMNAVNMLLTAPLDRGLIFSAKMIIFMLFLILAEIVLFPLFSFFMNFQGSANLHFWGLVLLVNWALSAIGILASGIGFKSRLGEVLTTLLLFPFSVPVMIGSIKSTKFILNGDKIEHYDEWLMILLTFSVCFTLAGLFLYDQILED